jgi:hypothetical protein
MIKANWHLLSLFLAGMVVGATALVIGEARYADSMRSFNTQATVIERCKRAADEPWNLDHNDAQRVIRISDCMASNGYVFTGAHPASDCYAENPIQVQIKHVLASCYALPTVLSKFAK